MQIINIVQTFFGGQYIIGLCHWVALRYWSQSSSGRNILGGLSEQIVTSWPLGCLRQTAGENGRNWVTEDCGYSHGTGMFLWIVPTQIRMWDHFGAKSCHRLSGAAVMVNNRMWFQGTACKKYFNSFDESRQKDARIRRAEPNIGEFFIGHSVCPPAVRWRSLKGRLTAI